MFCFQCSHLLCLLTSAEAKDCINPHFNFLPVPHIHTSSHNLSFWLAKGSTCLERTKGNGGGGREGIGVSQSGSSRCTCAEGSPVSGQGLAPAWHPLVQLYMTQQGPGSTLKAELYPFLRKIKRSECKFECLCGVYLTPNLFWALWPRNQAARSEMYIFWLFLHDPSWVRCWTKHCIWIFAKFLLDEMRSRAAFLFYSVSNQSDKDFRNRGLLGTRGWIETCVSLLIDLPGCANAVMGTQHPGRIIWVGRDPYGLSSPTPLQWTGTPTAPSGAQSPIQPEQVLFVLQNCHSILKFRVVFCFCFVGFLFLSLDMKVHNVVNYQWQCRMQYKHTRHRI